MLKLTKQKSQKWELILFGGLLGACVFLLVYGVGTLNVTNDYWILSGYDELDIVQRYAGWLNYRHSPWTFPLAKTFNLAFPEGCIITYMDSMPILCVFFKLFSGILPATFQFEGIYVLSIFILQGISAALLINEFVQSKIFTLIGTLFFVLSPILLERSFRHSSLASHYLILFAMYNYFKYRKDILSGNKKAKLPWLQMLILNIFAVGITPYFLPMVTIFLFLLALDNIIYTKRILQSLIFFFSNCAITITFAYILGSLGHGMNAVRKGFGEFSMNLNAPFNPFSLGGYSWSKFLPTLSQNQLQYDGFNYLGFGIILFSIVSVLLCVIKLIISKKPLPKLMTYLKKYGFLLATCVFLTCFAVSQEVYFGATKLFTVPLPDFVLKLCGIFRASSRMFYPVFYLIILFAIVVVYKFFKNKKHISIVITVVFLAIQVYDLSGVLYQKNIKMDALTATRYDGPQELMELQDYTQLLDIGGTSAKFRLYFAGKNNLPTNAWDANTGSYAVAQTYMLSELDKLYEDKLNKDFVYVTHEELFIDYLQEKFKDRADFYFWNNNLMFMIPKK